MGLVMRLACMSEWLFKDMKSDCVYHLILLLLVAYMPIEDKGSNEPWRCKFELYLSISMNCIWWRSIKHLVYAPTYCVVLLCSLYMLPRCDH